MTKKRFTNIEHDYENAWIKCNDDGECEYPTTFGCYYRDYDCEHECNECEETDECKYESGKLGSLVYAFNRLVEEGECAYNPLMGRHIDE